MCAAVAVLASCPAPSSYPLDAGQADDAGAERLPLTEVALPSLHCAQPVGPAPGSDCARDEDCADGELCALDPARPTEDRAPVSLRCGQGWGEGEPRARCAAAGDCLSGLCTLSGTCVEPCVSDADCGLGRACQRVELRVGDDALAPLSVCARSLAVPPEAQVENLGATGPLSADMLWEVTFPVRSGVSLLYLRAACARELQVQRLIASDNFHLFNIAALLTGQPALNPVVNLGTLVSVLVPNNPRILDLGAELSLSTVVDGTTSIERVAIWQQAEHSTLDLNVFYVGGGAFLTDGGLRPGDRAAGELFAQLDAGYREWGLRLGRVREYDVVGSLRDELSALETRVVGGGDTPADIAIARLDELFRLSAGVDDGGINLFFVEDMGEVLGISGGIPGSLGVHGTRASGVAVALDVVGLSAAPNVLMHEISHQMGLFHTSESDGFVTEPLTDTPECRPEDDASGDGVLSAAECAGLGAANLMFWAGGGSQLSEQQLAVLKASLALR